MGGVYEVVWGAKKVEKMTIFSKFRNESGIGLGWFWWCFGDVCESFGRRARLWTCILTFVLGVGGAFLVI